MRSQPTATTAEAAVTAGPAALLPGLLDEIVVWEILARLAPKPLLRCRAVCHAWRRVTSTRDFLLAHHRRQPPSPSAAASTRPDGSTRVSSPSTTGASPTLTPSSNLSPGLTTTTSSLYSSFVHKPPARSPPATAGRQLVQFVGNRMYLHGPSGEYSLLLYRTRDRKSVDGRLLPEPKIGCYVSALGSDHPPRYIEGPEAASALGIDTPVLVQGCLHWSPVQQQQLQHCGKSRLVVIVFDTTAESFRQLRTPVLPEKSCIFEMDGKLGIYRYNNAIADVDIWVSTDYEGEAWEYKHRVELTVAEFWRRFECGEDNGM